MKYRTKVKPFSRFILRTPLFPFKDTSATGCATDSAIFQEALFLASPDLYEGNQSNDPKKELKFKEAVLKYRHRASTRCTPFGLFAGCSVGTLGQKNEIELLPPEKSNRCTRLDMQYLCALIQRLEHDPSIRSQLRFYPNDSLYAIGGKYRYIEYRYQKTQRLHNVVSVVIDQSLEILLSVASNGATINEIARVFIDEQNTMEDAVGYVEEVIDAQILKSELEPSVVGNDVLDTLIQKLSRLQSVPILDTLCRIHSLLREIDSRPVGTTLPLYHDIIALIKRFDVDYEVKYLFQTDLYRPVVTASISTRTTDRISALIKFLSKISVPAERPALVNFIRAFHDRYEEEEVSLAQALDNELGIGYPVSENGGVMQNSLVSDLVLPGRSLAAIDIRLTPLDRILLKKYVECMRIGSSAVKLDDADFEGLSFQHNLPATFAVMCSLLGDDQLYIKSIGGPCGGTLLGRFCHLDENIFELVRESSDMEQQVHPSVIFAEISHLPEARIGNIALRPAFRTNTLHYLSNYEHDGQDIPISDLMLSVRHGRLFLRSKKYDKEVIPRLTCAHNYSLSPIPIYRFLCDLQHQGQTSGLQCSWNPLLFAGFEYLPRIQYEDILLSRQIWRLKSDEVQGYEKMSDDELRIAMSALMQKRRLPRHIVIPDADNELYVDLGDMQNVRLLLGYIAKRKRIVLEEFLFDESNAVVKQCGTAYTNEVIFVFHK